MFILLLRLSMSTPFLSDLSWYPVHDTVMGGRSEGGVRLNDQGMAFEGYLSLENNGGFTSIRSRDVPDSVMQAQGLRLRVVGDGRVYLATIRMKDYNRMLYLRVPFQTTKDKEEEIEIPFSSFQVFAYGRPTPQVPSILCTSSAIQSVGFMLADKKQGDFSLKVLSMETYGDRPQPPSISASQQKQIEQAIQVGVPLYNNGDIEGCARTYKQVLQSIQEKEETVWMDELLAQTPSGYDAQAWWFRHMINQLVSQSP
ncbi:MAG: hypothetical protein CL916_00835 [Deltaproteobacteria bacterium]|nr:hypothetical protein [Deltaproteobacteria bacterium]